MDFEWSVIKRVSAERIARAAFHENTLLFASLYLGGQTSSAIQSTLRVIEAGADRAFVAKRSASHFGQKTLSVVSVKRRFRLLNAPVT